MAEPFPAYDGLYVVSDLHLGGFDGTDSKQQARSYRIFRDTPPLVWLIEQLTERSVQGRTGLVLNGDIVDFLADASPSYFDVQNADRKLLSILDDREQRGVWSALRAYVRSGQGDLILVLGNHDVELALPKVRAELGRFLAGDDRAAWGRLRLALDGAGFRCTVGGRSVLCVHGNEADGWNTVDHPRLIQIARALNRDEAPPEWKANAGTSLVVDVMNDIKRDYQWVDLLKPETDDVALVLAAVAPHFIGAIRQLAPAAYHGVRDRVRQAFGFMGDPDQRPGISELESDERQFLTALQAVAGHEEVPGRQWLEQARADLAQKIDPLSLVGDGGDDMLGMRETAAWVGRVLKVRRDPSKLRTTLATVAGRHDGFDPNVPDDVFKTLDRLVGRNIDFLVAGHTHHAKAHRRSDARGVYLNSGTWIQLVRLSETALEEEHWPMVWEILQKGDLPSIERSSVDLLVRPRNLVKIEATATGVTGSIHTVCGALTSGFSLATVDRSLTLSV